jgi:hypothetical protein
LRLQPKNAEADERERKGKHEKSDPNPLRHKFLLEFRESPGASLLPLKAASMRPVNIRRSPRGFGLKSD